MKHIIKLFLCMLLCSSCMTHGTVCTDSVDIDVSNFSPLSDIFDGYRYIRLQRPDSCVLRSINKIVPTDSLLFIQDASVIYICDYDGTFLKKIDRQGHGRGEYLKINDWAVHGGKLWILDSQKSRLLSYGYDGTLAREYVLPDTFHSLWMLEDGNVFLCAQQSNDGLYNFIMYDTDSERVTKRFAGFRTNNSCTESGFHDFIGQCSDTLIVTNRFDNTVYNLTRDDYSPRFTFAFNTEEQLPVNREGLDYVQLADMTQFKNVVKHVYLYHQSESQIVLGYYLFDDYGDSYYLTKINHDGTQRTARLLVTVDSDFPYASPVIAQHNGEFVSFLQASQILNIEKYAKLDLFTNAGLGIDDNPVIFFHRIRPSDKPSNRK